MSLNLNLPILFLWLNLLLSILVSILLNLFLSYQFVVLWLLGSNVSFKPSINSSSDALFIFSIDSLSNSSIDPLSDSSIDSLSDSSMNFLFDFLFDTLTISSIGSSSYIFMISSS